MLLSPSFHVVLIYFHPSASLCKSGMPRKHKVTTWAHSSRPDPSHRGCSWLPWAALSAGLHQGCHKSLERAPCKPSFNDGKARLVWSKGSCPSTVRWMCSTVHSALKRLPQDLCQLRGSANISLNRCNREVPRLNLPLGCLFRCWSGWLQAVS